MDLSDRPAVLAMQDAHFQTAEGSILLKEVSVTFRAHSLTAIVGHNGSGKSTALKMLAGLNKPSGGRITLYGEDIASFDTRGSAKNVAYLAQDPGDGADYTVEELVALGRYPWHGPFGRLKDHDKRAIERAIALTGLEPLRQRAVCTLSGGERQRAWIAVTLAQQAPCLLLDEPISALDLAHQYEILLLLEELSKQDGLCIIAVLHDINLAARFADQIVALKDGHLIADGPPRTIMQPDMLRDIFGIDMLVQPHPTNGHPLALANV
ncbi:ABC transporter ATP-binding protein [Thalassospira australica]